MAKRESQPKWAALADRNCVDTAASAELVEARKDTARLNWLARHKGTVSRSAIRAPRERWYAVADGMVERGPTIREAIDKLMRVAKR